jgi:hypothetical protein
VLVIVLLSLNGIMTLVSSLGLGRFFSTSLAREIDVGPEYVTAVPTAPEVNTGNNHGINLDDRSSMDDRRITMLRVDGVGRRRTRPVTVDPTR